MNISIEEKLMYDVMQGIKNIFSTTSITQKDGLHAVLFICACSSLLLRSVSNTSTPLRLQDLLG